MMEPAVNMVELSPSQWIAIVSFTIFTIGFFIWVARLARK
jgi:hypothetical protein